MRDNAAILTAGSKAYAKKRKARKEQVEEVSFDPDARRTFLTGFHKRKVQRRERAIAQAKAKEREEHLEMRREKREQRKEMLAQKIMESKTQYGIDSPKEEDEKEDSEDSEDDKQKDVSVLPGESSVTTVTVTKGFDPTRIDDEDQSDGLQQRLTPQDILKKLMNEAIEPSSVQEDDEEGKEEDGDNKQKSKTKPNQKKKKKFRYETKAKRAERNYKAKGKNTAAAAAASNNSKRR